MPIRLRFFTTVISASLSELSMVDSEATVSDSARLLARPTLSFDLALDFDVSGLRSFLNSQMAFRES